ncbi:hypothetical protein CEXT_158711 [Caerostris extrusa]|uniref:Uncharacterized protein n=1 Tax=Caerostris extrusa TaxID=172846 RepID=A0AAV4UKI8_CAEEX|nr:hypothetical protein CEXT_158711 [Caerostris extrusa]
MKKEKSRSFLLWTKIKEEWKPKSSTSDADKPKIDKKGNNENVDIFKHQRTQGNKGNFEANKQITNNKIFPSSQQTYLQKRIQTENFNVPHDELFSRNLEANLSNQTSIMNVNSSNLTPQFNTSFPSHVHQTRGFHKNSNRGSNFQLSSKEFETPVQIRVFSGYQESNTPINNLKATNIGRSQTKPNFYPGHNSEEIRFQQLNALHSQKAFSSGKSQAHKPINSNSQTAQCSEVDFSSRHRGFNMEPKNTFLSPLKLQMGVY